MVVLKVLGGGIFSIGISVFIVNIGRDDSGRYLRSFEDINYL